MTATPRFAYVGSFTTAARKARGDGIHVYAVDGATGAWTHVQHVGDLVNPSFLALDPAQRHLYSVHADETVVSAFAIDPTSGRLAFVNRQSVSAKNPVHLAFDASGRFLVTANYGGGTVSVLAVGADGALGPMVDSVTLEGELGPHRIQQTGARPHHSPFDPTRTFVVVPDKGLDRVFVFRLGRDGKLIACDPPSVASRRGAAPRHVDFHPRLPIAYVLNELDSTLTTYRWDTGPGSLTPLAVAPTLPISFTGNNTTAEIWVAASGRFVYASNRGHDSIAIFAVDPASGVATPIAWEPTQGRVPRFFAIDPAGRFLYAANQQSDTIVTFRIDAETGALTPTGQVIANPTPVCIVFSTL